MEQVRIAKEMRKRDEQNGRAGVDVRCRYLIWENVPGALSSGKPSGEDFRCVLEELARIVDEGVTIPRPPKKWSTTGVIIGDGYSLAWRVMDAQYYGVPQRRRRIALVADFNGYTAAEILFSKVEHHGSTERNDSESSFGDIGGGSPEIQTLSEGLSRHSQPSKQKRKESSSDASGSFGADDSLGADQYNGVILGDTVSTLGVNCGMSHGRQCILEPKEVVCFEPGIASREGGHIYENVSGTLRAKAGDNQMAAAYTLKIRSGCEGGGKGALVQTDKSATLATNNDQYLFQPVYSVENHPNDSRVGINEDGMVQALTSRMGTGGGNVPMVMQCYSKSKRAQSDTDYETWKESDTANTLNGFDTGDVRTSEAVVYALDRTSFNQGKNAQYDFEISDKGIISPLVAKGPGAVCYSFDPTASRDAGDYILDGVANPLLNGTENDVNGALQSNSAHSLNGNNVVRTRYIVRRLTPLECERLQGYPDNWTRIGEVIGYNRQIDERTGEEYVEAIYEYIDANGKKRKTSDAARYKALGNSIALPPWKWILKRLCACYERDATTASLFDGIGGFPLLWEQINGKGSCLWASEIEEFPIAVTKARIGE